MSFVCETTDMKYGNKKVQIDGHTFDSASEARRWIDLGFMQRAGQISELERQVTLQLLHGVRLHGEKRARPPVRLVVDFRYVEHGVTVWEDTKGMETPASRMKRHMAKALLGIDVEITP